MKRKIAIGITIAVTILLTFVSIKVANRTDGAIGGEFFVPVLGFCVAMIIADGEGGDKNETDTQKT